MEIRSSSSARRSGDRKRASAKELRAPRLQLQLRRDFLGKYGPAIYGERASVVLGIVLDEPLEDAAPPDALGVHTKATRWSDLPAYDAHPRAAEFQRYYEWKLDHSTPPRKPILHRRGTESRFSN